MQSVGMKKPAMCGLIVVTNLGTFNIPVVWLTSKLDQALEWKPLMVSIGTRIYPTVVAKIWSKTSIN